MKTPEEILHQYSCLRIWFDRDISFDTGSDLRANIVCLPRRVAPCSNVKLNENWAHHRQAKLELKLVELAIDSTGIDTALASKSTIFAFDRFWTQTTNLWITAT